MGRSKFDGRIYTITIKNWEKYNGAKKKGHRCILISTGFLSDARIASQTQSGRLLMLCCLLLAGDSTSSQFQVTHKSLANQSGVKSESLESQLDRLQSFQLISVEKNDSFINRIEKKGIERNRKEGNRNSNDRVFEQNAPEENSQQEFPNQNSQTNEPEKPEPAEDVVEEPKGKSTRGKSQRFEGVNEVIGAYVDAFKSRYRGTTPPISRKVAGQFKTLVEDFGKERSTLIVQAYLKMNDPWFVNKRHDVGTLLTNLNSIAHFSYTGEIISKKEIQNLDSSNALTNQLQAIERGEI